MRKSSLVLFSHTQFSEQDNKLTEECADRIQSLTFLGSGCSPSSAGTCSMLNAALRAKDGDFS